MLTVTDSAKEHLNNTLKAHRDDPNVCLRLVAKPAGQLGFVLDTETKGDQVVEHEGISVLLIGQELTSLVEGLTLDARDTANGPELFISKV
jgi:Fe-S cluster assembly iron-binding protein IscA